MGEEPVLSDCLFDGELDRPVRAVVRAACNEISHEEVCGFFCYLLVGAVADAPDMTR